MAVYHAESLLFAPLAERPELSDPTIYSASGIALFLATDTGGLYETSGSAWTLLGTLLGTSLPGVSTNGEGGISALGSSVFGGNSQEVATHELDVFGAFFTYDTPGTNTKNFMVEFQQQAALTADNPAPVLYVDRTALQNGHLFTQPVLVVGDDTGSGQHIALFYGSANVTIGSAGGIGLFNATPPAAPRTLAQSAINAITDTNAKTAVQAVANALADMGALTLT